MAEAYPSIGGLAEAWGLWADVTLDLISRRVEQVEQGQADRGCGGGGGVTGKVEQARVTSFEDVYSFLRGGG